MNFLAHLYLSGDSPKLKIGNFIGDWVKGRDWANYPTEIGNGIKLHRAIDEFTDNNIFFKESKKIFQKNYGHYAGVVTDMVYDHILAKKWDKYPQTSLNRFAKNAYILLMANYSILPKQVKGFIFRMTLSRRLESYAKIEGIVAALDIMATHSRLPRENEMIINIFNEHENTLELQFQNFFCEITEFTKQKKILLGENENIWM